MAMKRANGTGSVYKLSGHRRRPFIAVLTTGWSDDGKRYRKIIGYFKSAKEGWDALTMYGLNPAKYDTRTITFGDIWDIVVKENERRGLPLSKQRAIMIKHCYPLFKTPVQNIKTA